MLCSFVGALLSLLIDPIYYGSIIVGSLYHRDSIERALFRRIEQVRWLRLSLKRINLMMIYLVSEGSTCSISMQIAIDL